VIVAWKDVRVRRIGGHNARAAEGPRARRREYLAAAWGWMLSQLQLMIVITGVLKVVTGETGSMP
jgi:hypothetical protein